MKVVDTKAYVSLMRELTEEGKEVALHGIEARMEELKRLGY